MDTSVLSIENPPLLTLNEAKARALDADFHRSASAWMHGKIVPHWLTQSSRSTPVSNLLGVVLVGVGKSATAVQVRARKMVAEALQDDSVLFGGVVRHSEATAQATRERGLWCMKGTTPSEKARSGTSSYAARRRRKPLRRSPQGPSQTISSPSPRK